MDSNFPDEFVDPIEKTTKEYGLQYAKTMWNSYSNYGGSVGYNSWAQYQLLIEVAQGRQSIDNLKKHIGFINDELMREGLTYLSLQNIPIAPKFINLVQGKLNKIEYDISVDAIDPVALDQKKQYEATARAFINLKEFLGTVGTDTSTLTEGIDISSLPETTDELEISLQMNYKNKKALEYELKLKEVHNINDWRQIKRELAFDLVVLGLAGTFSWMDKNGTPREKRISPDRLLFSQTNSEAFGDIQWGGHIEYLTPADLRREMSGEYTNEEIEEKILEFGGLNNYDRYANYGFGAGFYGVVNRDNISYIPVLRFQFLSEDTYKFVASKNKKGNPSIERKSYKYRPLKTDLPLYEGENKQKELIENTITNKYGGSWIIGGECVYGYDRLPTPRTPKNKVNAKLDYNLFAPNMQKGRIVSMLSQMIEPLYMANLSWNKIKDILAKEYIGILNIDFDALTKVAMLKKSGEAFNPKEILDLFFQSKIALTARKINQYDQSNGDAVRFVATGITLTDYSNMFNMAINQIRSVTGINELSDASTPAPGTLNGVAEIANQSTNTALDYLYHAEKHIYNKTSESQLLFIQAKDEDSTPLHEFIVGLNKRPDEQEWNTFYGQVQASVTAGLLTPADQVFLRNVDNLKLAEQIMIVRERKREKEAALQRKAAVEEQSNAIIQQTQSASQLRVQELQAEWSLKTDYMLKEKAEEKQIQQMKNEGIIISKQIDSDTKVATTKQQGTDTIIKEAQRSHSDQTIEFAKHAHEKELSKEVDKDSE